MATISNEEYADYSAKIAEKDSETVAAAAVLLDEAIDALKTLNDKVANFRAGLPQGVATTSSRGQVENVLNQIQGFYQQTSYLKSSISALVTPPATVNSSAAPTA